MWLQYIEANKENENLLVIPIPSYFYNLKTSYVGVKDIARLVVHLLDCKIQNEIFNIGRDYYFTFNYYLIFPIIILTKGYDEHLTLVEFIKLLASIIKPDFEKLLKFKEEKNCRFKHEFPSVTVAPVDTTKIKTNLNFQFTDVRDSIKEIVNFYNKAYKEFPSERRLIAKDVAKEIYRSDEERDAFKDFIRTFNP